MTVQDIARELADAIKDTDEYNNYISIKQEVSENPELTKSVNLFQEKQFDLQKMQIAGGELTPDVIAEMQGWVGTLMKDPLAARYIQAEVRFSIMVNDIYSIIGEAVKG